MASIDGFQLSDLLAINKDIEGNPYLPNNHLLRAEWYEINGFPDLAAGDVYKALLLSDELRDESGEYHEEVLKSVELATNPSQIQREGSVIDGSTNCISADRVDKQIYHNDQVAVSGMDSTLMADEIASRSYELLALSLSKCGCLKTAYDFAARGSEAFPHIEMFRIHRAHIVEQYCKRISKQGSSFHGIEAGQTSVKDQELSFNPLTDLPEEGSVRRELYPWNEHEPDRFSMTNLRQLNERLAIAAPKCEVRAVLLPSLESKLPGIDEMTNHNEFSVSERRFVKQLGLFATADIAPYETILEERSLLTTNNRLHDTLCDACSALLPEAPCSSALPHCPDCEDTIFCSEMCAGLAQKMYHPAICGKSDFDLLTKDPSPATSSSALYLALLGRTFAMAETQNVHPLDLSETSYLWGDFSPPPSDAIECEPVRQLPFTFHNNISGPLHMLERMDVNIFTSQLSETWVINTLYAKFRGTASARFSTSASRFRGPEVAAVHPLWCLANHSCAPNVKWEWAGNIKFEARGGQDVVRWGPAQEKCHEGIREGEEILSHYCDVHLPVEDRREWAMGALGGQCVCKRCKWEDQRDRKGQNPM
ncbi:MAG: hypothetical protein Q9191_002852 [Dirinaria sp. TL-2023a]